MDVDEKKPVRRTRSGAKASPVQSSKPGKTTTRKTKKKVVVMEVEVSEEEDVGQEDETTIEDEKQEIESSKDENKNIDEEDGKKESSKSGSKVEDDFFVFAEEDTECLENTESTKENGKNSSDIKMDTDEEKPKSDEEQQKSDEEKRKSNEEKRKSNEEKKKSDEGKQKCENIEPSNGNLEKVCDNSPDKKEIKMDIDEDEKEPELVKKESELVKKEPELVKKEPELVKKEPELVKKEVKTEPIQDSKNKESKDSEDLSEDIKKTESDSKVTSDAITETKKAVKDEADTDEKENAPKVKTEDEKEAVKKSTTEEGEPDTENISEDELPTVQAVKVPETEEVSDEELPGPKRAELPADTEVVSEDELPSVKKDTAGKRKLAEGEYDPCSPTSETETPAKKVKEDKEVEKESEEKVTKPKKLPELDKFWKAVNDDPTDFTGWTYLLQYVDQENDMEAAREAYDAFLSHYPYCYGYWRKYADYEKRKGNKKKCEEVFERGLKAIPLSVDLWLHYLNYVKSTRQDEEDFLRSQFDRAIAACGLEFRSDRLWDSYIKWESEAKRLQRVTGIYDKLLATPTQGYTAHFESFQEHVTINQPNKVLDVDEFLALRKEVKNLLKNETAEASVDSDAPPGDEDLNKMISSDEESKLIRERIISIRRKIHKNTVTAVSARWNFEEGIKRPYFHVKPLERCQLKNWHDYLDFEIQQSDKTRIIVLFERCLIACALYEEFWLKFIHYLNNLKEEDVSAKIKDVYERACTIHHLKKPNLHLQWAIFEESNQNANRAAEILVNLEKCVPNLIHIAQRRINLEKRRGDHEKCSQLYEHYITTAKNKVIASYHAIKFSRFQHKVLKNFEKAVETLKNAITKDPLNPRLYLNLVDLTLQKEDVSQAEIVEIFDSFSEKEGVDIDQKAMFVQRKLEYLEDFSSDISAVQKASEEYQKLIKQSKEASSKRKDNKSDPSSNKKEKSSAPTTPQSGPYGPYGNYNASGQGSYQYSGNPPQGQYNYQQYGQNEQYPYQNWQYPQGGYGYNQWGSYGGSYGY